MKIDRCYGRILHIFEIDYRSLALTRIALAAIIVLDLINRGQHLTAHYTDQGVLPRTAWLAKQSNDWHFSFHAMGGLPIHQAILFGAAGVIAVFLLTGYKTHAMTPLSWLFLLSLHNRNPLVLQSGDTLLRMLVFWGIFLPWGSRFAVDCDYSNDTKLGKSVCSAATAAVLIQVCLVYWFTNLRRTDPAWWNGQAVYLALNNDVYATALGLWLRQNELACTILSYMTMAVELAGPIVVFSPIFTGMLRFMVVLAMITFHFGIGLTMELGLFPAISIAGWLFFIPSWIWDRIENCNAVQILRNQTQWIRLIRAYPREPNRDPGYSSRELLSETVPHKTAHMLMNLGCFFLLVYVLCLNTVALDSERFKTILRPSFRHIGYLLRLNQDWRMFSPSPRVNDGWFVIAAKQINGSEIDLLTGTPPNWEKPLLVSAQFPSQRWRRYMTRLAERPYSDYRLYFGRYLTREWNGRHKGDARLDSFRIYFMKNTSEKAGGGAPIKILLWRHNCLPSTSKRVAYGSEKTKREGNG